MTSSDVWGDETAERYDETSAEKFAPEVLGPTVDFLADLAGSGAAWSSPSGPDASRCLWPAAVCL